MLIPLKASRYWEVLGGDYVSKIKGCYMTREELIDALMRDFANMFPDNDRATTRLMQMTLSGMETSDLELLNNGAEGNQ